MANSIILKSNKHNSRYLQLECTQKSNGSAKNSSTITWKLSAIGDSTWYSTGPTKVIINGTTVYNEPRMAWDEGVFPVAQGSTSGTITIPHNNDGSKKITVKFSTAIYTSTVTEYSDEWTLDSIARYGTSEQTLNQKTETTIKMNWSSDNTVDYLWYSTNNGTDWTGLNVTDGKSGTYTISNLSPNTTYKIKTRIRRKDSQLTTDSSALSVTTYDYPYCTDSPNFILGDELTLKFYNPLSRAFKFYIIGNGTQIDVEYNCSTTSYKGVNNTASSVPYLYATIPNAKSGKYKVKVVYGSSTKTRDNGNTYTIKESACYPTFTTFAYKDANTTVTNITGNNQVLVKGLSKLAIEISSTNKMIAINGATPKKYVASIDTLSASVNYSTSAISKEVGVLNTTGTKRLNVTAYDSRDLIKTAYKDVVIYDYAKPVINVSAKRLNNFEAETTLTVSGSYSKLNIGGADKNTLKSVQYRYKEVGGTWGSWTNLTTTINNGKYTCNNVLLTLDNTKEFQFEVKVTDSFGDLTSKTASVKVDVGQVILMVSSNKKTAYINGVEVATRGIIKEIYPVGSVYCCSTNTNPASKFGGTWQLIDKGFKSYSVYTPSMFTAGTNVVADTVYLSRGANTIRIRLSVVVNSALSDTGMSLGTLNWDVVGITGLHAGIIEQLAYRDGANGGIVYSVFHESGEIQQVDVFDLTPLPSGSTFYLDFTFVVGYDRMLDSVCDKFYWKRTA